MLFDEIAKVIVDYDTLYLKDKFLLLFGSQQTDINSVICNPKL